MSPPSSIWTKSLQKHRRCHTCYLAATNPTQLFWSVEALSRTNDWKPKSWRFGLDDFLLMIILILRVIFEVRAVCSLGITHADRISCLQSCKSAKHRTKALPREMMPSDQTGQYDAIPSKTIMIFSGLTPTSTMFSASISTIRFII